MIATIVFATQVLFSFVSFGLLARWIVYPRLVGRPLAVALTPLLLFHSFRTVGLSFLVPTVVDAKLPVAFAVPAAIGDMLAVILALVALVSLCSSWRGALALVWLFNIEGTVDLLYAIYQGLSVNLAGAYHLGFAWLISTYYVPAALVAHLMIFALLVQQTGRVREGQPVYASPLSTTDSASVSR